MVENILVCGLGVSGDAAARLLVSHGHSVQVVDGGDTPVLQERAEQLRQLGVDVQLRAESASPCGYHLCVLSPGISIHSPWLDRSGAEAVPVVSELELGSRYVKAPMLAITGSNGKSTFAKLCAESLALAGKKVALVGNYGDPLCSVANASSDLDWLVVEVSSFQLEAVETFRPAVAVLLNLFPNHLDRHATMSQYRDLKLRLFANQSDQDRALIFDELGDDTRSWTRFGAMAEADYRISNSVISTPSGDCYDLTGTVFSSGVLGLSAAGVVAAVEACGVDAECVVAAAHGFERLPHRMQPVGTLGGVDFVDDSKATNLAAMAAAVDMQSGPVRLIAGGVLKEKELKSVKELLAKKVAAVYLIGNAMNEMADAWGDSVVCHRCRDLESAVELAWRESKTGDTVLLSPACASFDQFKSYAMRGDVFLECVKILRKEKSG